MDRRPSFVVLLGAAVVIGGCGGRGEPARAPYTALAEVEAVYGPLITAGNHPTPDQHGTGERVGLFQDASGTVWGLPLAVTSAGRVLACAPPALRDGRVTGTLPADAAVIGSANRPTAWRGGTGDLELVLREQGGRIGWQPVRGAYLASGPSCWAAEAPGPPQQLYYYRLARAPRGGR